MNLMDMKNNLIQNFYIIGLSQEDIFLNIKNNDKPNKLIDIFSLNSEISFPPKVISKFPPTNSNHNSIPNEIIIEHCFPKGLKIIKSDKKDISYNCYHFWFELDNLKYGYLTKYKSLYSKIYFTCLNFNESLEDYQNLKSEIDKVNNINNDKESNNNNYNNYYIPKVICFASLVPFTKELVKILSNIYDYYLYYKNNINGNNLAIMLNNSPLEKIIEQIIMCLPFPLSTKDEYILSYKFNCLINSTSNINNSTNNINNLKNNLNKNQNSINNFPYNNTNIIFPVYDPLNCFMNDLYSSTLYTIFLFFNEEEVVRIFKYLVLEIPILFFSENISLLSKVIQGFLSLLQPFKYILPNSTILPSKFYGIINSESKFVFGIAENYSIDFFKNNNILLDKTIIIVNFLNSKKVKIEEIKKMDDQKDYVIIDNYNIFNFINNDSISPNGNKIDLVNIDFPIKAKKKLINNIKSYLNETKKKKDNSSEHGHIFNRKIRHFFYRFFTNILCGYTDYLLKINNYNINNNAGYYSGDNIRYKINYNNSNSNSNNYLNNEILFIKSVFNMDEFISKFPKDNHMFYRAFCNTKLFHNFIREMIFSNDELISLKYKYFNLITFFKKHKDLKQIKYKELLLKYKNIFNQKKEEKSEPKLLLNILNDSNFNLDEKKIMLEKNKQNEALISYSQLINILNSNSINSNINKINNIINQQIFLKYYIFPKIFFDDKFFDNNYDKLFFRHYLEMPNHSKINKLYQEIKELNKNYFENYSEILFSKIQKESNNSTKTLIDLRSSSNLNFIKNNSNEITINPNLEILVDNYIEYNWLLLISCSLWYCSNPVETEIRINKIFDILEKIDFIEEQVLFFLYMAVFNFGNKSQFVKIFEFLNRFMGYSTYTNWIYLCLKLGQKEEEANKHSKDNIVFKKRTFFDMNEIKKNYKNETENENKKDINNIQKEEIIFYTTQKCPYCNKENKIGNISELIHHRISQKRDNLFYRCSQCDEENLDIIIKYILSLNNKKKNETITIAQGQFKLIPPHKIYQQMKEKFIYLNEGKLDIDHIFTNDNVNLLNNIFYFSDRQLPFDFLIPYEGQENREYFMVEEEDDDDEKENINTTNKNKNVINKDISIFSINNQTFSLSGKD